MKYKSIQFLLGLAILFNSGTTQAYEVKDRSPLISYIPDPSLELSEAKYTSNSGRIDTTAILPDSSIYPLFIIQENIGQSNKMFSHVVRGVNFAAGFTPNSITLAVARYPIDSEIKEQGSEIAGNLLTLSFKNSNQGKITGEAPINAPINSLIGADKKQWAKPPSFQRLVYNNLYPGVQMFIDGNNSHIEYSFNVDPNSDVAKIRVSIKGVLGLKLDSVGNLIMRTSGGDIVQTKPKVFEIKEGETKVLNGNFVIINKNEYGFEVEKRTPNTSLIIDPDIVFTTYFGGLGQEGMLGGDMGADDFIGRGFDIAIGPNGNIFVIGMTVSADFPVTTPGPINGSADVFVIRLDPSQSGANQLLYATFIGGSSAERGRAVAPLNDGRAYITGHTDSGDFPTSDGTIQPNRVRSGAYLVRLSPDGEFEIGTMLGAGASFHPNSVVFNKRSNENMGFVYVAGSVRGFVSSDATSNAFQTNFGGGQFDGFVVKLDTELTRYEYLTYLGGSDTDTIMDLDVNDGYAFLTGTTTSINFPSTEIAFQSQHSQANTAINCGSATRPRECFDIFVNRLNRLGSDLVYGTFIGSNQEDYARGIAVASNNQATITGAARSTTGNNAEILIARLEGGGENLLFDVRIPAEGTDHGEEVVIDQFGRAHVTGTISIDGQATANTFNGGGSDIFYGRVTNEGNIDFFTYLGGRGTDRGFAIAASGTSEESFCAAVAGSTTSDDIQTLNELPSGDVRSGSADLLLYALCDVAFSPNASNFQKTAPPQVGAGEIFTYGVTVTNGGDRPAPVTVTDTVPNNATVTNVTGIGCTHTGNNVTCSFNAQPGATTILITARAGSQCPSTINNSATIRIGNQEFSTPTTTTRINCLCGNRRLDAGEECDGGSNCRANCTLASCGDGIPDPREQCDDGNQNNSDQCSNQCTTQRLSGQSCSENGPACAGDLVCGKRSGVVEECWFFDLFCDSYLMWESESTCMPKSEADSINGP